MLFPCNYMPCATGGVVPVTTSVSNTIATINPTGTCSATIALALSVT